MQELSLLLDRLKSIESYPFDSLKDAALLDALQREFPNVDFFEELARLSIWLSDLAPGYRRIHHRLLLRKWIYNASKKAPL